MPIDESHGRNIPAGLRMAAVLRQFLAQFKRNAIQSLVRHQLPEISYNSLYELSAVLVPEYERHMTNGALDTVKRVRQGLAVPPAVVDLSRAFDLFLPAIKTAAQNMSVAFAREFGATTQQAVRDAISDGYSAGEPLSRIQARLQRINTTGTISDRVTQASVFSRERAATVARYEASYAVHEGQMRYGMSIGATGLQWLASSDACKQICLPLKNKKVPYGTPFYVHPKGEEEYKYVYHPPAHPNCMCSSVDYFEDEPDGSSDTSITSPAGL